MLARMVEGQEISSVVLYARAVKLEMYEIKKQMIFTRAKLPLSAGSLAAWQKGGFVLSLPHCLRRFECFMHLNHDP